MRNVLFAVIATSIPLVRAHIAFYDPAMWGFNVHREDFPYDNRPMAPLYNYTREEWWFHGHLGYPPEPGNFFELPAGGGAVSQLACNRGATKWWVGSEGSTDIRQGDYPCPGSPTSAFHGINDLGGCALSIAYNSDVNSIQPEDLAVFSVNQTCVWTVSTIFEVPREMPPCPPGGCICAWHWIHKADSGSEQNYMNGFRCNVTGSTFDNPIMKPVVPKRCTGNPSECNQGAQQPFWWLQAEGNNVFNDYYDPPGYQDDYGFFDGAQNHIFENGNGSTSNISTPPANNTYSSTPASMPSSTPGSSPTPTPANYISNEGNGGDSPGSSLSSSPYPSSSGNPTCNSNKNKKRQGVVSRHFKHKRHH